MPDFNRWFGRKSRPQDALSRTAEFPPTNPDAVHQSNWASLKREGKFVIKPGRNMDEQILILIVGAPGVGKKTLIKRLLYGDMLGGERLDQSMLLMEDEIPRYYCDGCIYSLKVILVTDPEASMPAMLLRYDYFGLVLAYDVNSRDSLDFVSQLQERLTESSEQATSALPTAILGLKSDLEQGQCDEEGRRISCDQGEKLARISGCHFDKCSSKTGHRVYASFGYFVEEARKTRQVEIQRPSLPTAAVCSGPDNQATRAAETFAHAARVGRGY